METDIKLKENNTIKTVAAYWGCDYSTVYGLVRSGELRHFQLGKTYRIKRQDVIDYEVRNTCQDQDLKTQNSFSNATQMEYGKSTGQKTEERRPIHVAQEMRMRRTAISCASSKRTNEPIPLFRNRQSKK